MADHCVGMPNDGVLNGCSLGCIISVVSLFVMNIMLKTFLVLSILRVSSSFYERVFEMASSFFIVPVLFLLLMIVTINFIFADSNTG